MINSKYKITVTEVSTGKVIPTDVYIKRTEKEQKGYWQKSYAEVLASYLNIAGTSTTKVLAHIIKEKNSTNMIHGTVREIGELAGVSSVTVSRVFKVLVEADLLRKVRNGCYILNQNVIGPGDAARSIAVIQLWEEAK